MSAEEKAFWKLLSQLATEGKLLGDAAERIGMAFDAAMSAATKTG